MLKMDDISDGVHDSSLSESETLLTSALCRCQFNSNSDEDQKFLAVLHFTISAHLHIQMSP